MNVDITSSGLLAVGNNTINSAASTQGGPSAYSKVYLHGVQLIPGSAASTVVVYDGSSAVSGKELCKVQGTANGQSVDHEFNYFVPANSGQLFVVVAGTGAAAIVHYSLA